MDAVVDDLVTKEDVTRQTTLSDYNGILLDAAHATKMYLPSTTTTTVAPTTPTVNLVRVNFICNERMLEKQHHTKAMYTKIDVKPIFRPLERCHNLASILETPEIGVTSISACTNNNT